MSGDIINPYDRSMPQQVSRLRAGAKLSTNRVYRYALWRPVPLTEEVSVKACVFIGLNPSTADETTDDPTVRRCWGFALREGCGLMVLINLFAFRATEPEDLFRVVNPVGPGNNRALVHYTTGYMETPTIICCWGNAGSFRQRDREVVHLLREKGADLQCFGTTLEGHPKHPLYLKANTPLIPLPEYV